MATLGEGGSYCSFTRVGLILTRNKRQNVSPWTFLIYRIYFWILLFRLFVSTRWCSVAGFLSRTRGENKSRVYDRTASVFSDCEVLQFSRCRISSYSLWITCFPLQVFQAVFNCKGWCYNLFKACYTHVSRMGHSHKDLPCQKKKTKTGNILKLYRTRTPALMMRKTQIFHKQTISIFDFCVYF